MQGKWVRRAATVALAVLVSLGLSGCFLWSSFEWSSNTVKAGKSTNAVIGMTPAAIAQTKNKGYSFILVGFNDVSALDLGGKKVWDVKGKFGGPEQMFTDGALATAALNGDGCLFAGQHLSDIDDTVWKAVRTGVKINDRDKVGVIATSQVAIKADQGAGSNQEQLYFIGGGWEDDGDSTPENNEVGCSGGTLSTVSIKD